MLPSADETAGTVAIERLEALGTAASGAHVALADLVGLVGFRRAVRITGLPQGTLQRWVSGLPATVTLDAARQRRDDTRSQP